MSRHINRETKTRTKTLYILDEDDIILPRKGENTPLHNPIPVRGEI
jgi:hypothetical protein